MKSETVRILTEARDRVKRGWTRFSMAKSASGRDVEPWSKAAVSWCAYGAIRASGKAGGGRCLNDDEQSARKVLTRVIKHHSVFRWNDADDRRQSDVVRAFNDAIRLAKADQP